MNLIWRSSARRDIETIITYIAERNVDAAQRLKLQIEDCAERLPDHPFMCTARVGCPARVRRWCTPITS